jgi:hypothetical protein
VSFQRPLVVEELAQAGRHVEGEIFKISPASRSAASVRPIDSRAA